jgi:hypothetical protein
MGVSCQLDAAASAASSAAISRARRGAAIIALHSTSVGLASRVVDSVDGDMASGTPAARRLLALALLALLA